MFDTPPLATALDEDSATLEDDSFTLLDEVSAVEESGTSLLEDVSAAEESGASLLEDVSAAEESEASLLDTAASLLDETSGSPPDDSGCSTCEPVSEIFSGEVEDASSPQAKSASENAALNKKSFFTGSPPISLQI